MRLPLLIAILGEGKNYWMGRPSLSWFSDLVSHTSPIDIVYLLAISSSVLRLNLYYLYCIKFDMEHHWQQAQAHHLSEVQRTENALLDLLRMRRKASLKRRLGRINKLSELIRRRSDIEARMISTMRDLNSAYSVAKQRTQVSLHRSVRWMKGGTENGSQSSHPVHGRYHGETVWLVLHSSVALQNEVPDYCQYYLQQYKVKSVNLALEVVPFSKISTEWHTQPLVIIVDRLQLAI